MYYSRTAEGGNRSTGSADASERVLGAAAGSGPALVDLEAAERARLIDEIRALEDLKSAVAAAQARATAAFDASSRRSQARAGLKADQLGRGIGSQIGLARRESPRRGTQLLGLARILTTEMPHTLNALSQGVISEYRATILVRETACLSLPDRQCVDEQIAGNLAELEQLGDAKLIARIKALSYGLDPHSVVNRAAKAVSERYVSCRPAPDTMTYLTGLLPVTQGVGVYAALSREADQVCRMPWCGAPIRHYDHIRPFREGGLTRAENIQGLCVACNQAKEAPGWDSVVTGGVEAPESSEVPATPGTPAAPPLPPLPSIPSIPSIPERSRPTSSTGGGTLC
ncbi:DUF222 domain-containing protein [Arthrobacter sp. zg-Y1219]|uniref:HNH endonuclease n=1 Tax=Arthrobacter sp. zg-Y1219 TaxID=3049067 RepID=UPI0024C33261|nr:HNH endonuclease signature motif containing protein [Arthrobacter sp. zg-Y1219]MDK1358801.1 DUF222 domain-containing protein [Arthrobacter sp. zg-Y1219]